MVTIAEPKNYITNLWGKQQIEEGSNYRLMRYVFKVSTSNGLLLHNVITGHLILLNNAEIELLYRLPMKYDTAMNQLISEHFLVPEKYDEHQQTLVLRKVLHKLEASEKVIQDITHYTILPTTACNAQCYYCYEHGVYKATMTEEIAENTISFIADHCNKKKVSIRWFGGEPTLAHQRIDQISKGLLQKGISYTSNMTTNGYLFDEEMVKKAKSLWKLRSLMISVDGIEEHYNAIKSYINVNDNPYQRVMRNIGFFLNNGIKVGLRMNFDIGNYQDFMVLLEEAATMFQGNNLLQVYAFPVKGAYPDKTGRIVHGSPEWFNDKIAELNDMAQKAGLFFRSLPLPSLFFSSCKAGDSSSMVIGPTGELARCTSIFDRKDQIVGNVKQGIRDQSYLSTWNKFSDLQNCVDCTFFPSCILIENCPGKGKCFLNETRRQHEETIKKVFNQWVQKNHIQGGN